MWRLNGNTEWSNKVQASMYKWLHQGERQAISAPTLKDIEDKWTAETTG